MSLVIFSLAYLVGQAFLSKPAPLHQCRVKYVNALDLEPCEHSYFWEGRR